MTTPQEDAELREALLKLELRAMYRYRSLDHAGDFHMLHPDGIDGLMQLIKARDEQRERDLRLKLWTDMNMWLFEHDTAQSNQWRVHIKPSDVLKEISWAMSDVQNQEQGTKR